MAKKKHKSKHKAKVAPAPTASTATGSTTPASGTGGVDQFGIIELYQTKSGATSWYLNSGANNKDLTIHQIKGSITKQNDRGFPYFSAPVDKGALKSGGSRYTFRMDVRASGEKNGSQKYNYQNGAITNGFCENEQDIGDCEFTFVGRRKNTTGEHVIEFALRGGDHHDSSPDSSCVCCMYPTVAQSSGSTPSKNYNYCFQKELIHAVIDGVHVPTLTSSPGWPVNTWIAVKGVTFRSKSDGSEVTNRIYYDADPIDFTSNPPKMRNKYTLLAEYIDKGKSTGNYSTLVNWAGCTLSIRIDNVGTMDFYGVSIRSIVPTLNTNTGGDNSVPGGGGGVNGAPPPPPPPGSSGSGGTGTGSGTGGTVSPTAPPVISTPKTHNYIDVGGKLANPINIWFIYWGSYWNGTITAPAPTAQNITDATTAIFNSHYFEALFQYRNLTSPVFPGAVVNTTFAPISGYTEANITSLIDDTKTQNLIPTYDPTTEEPNYLYVIFSDPTHSSSASVQSSHGSAKYLYAFVNTQTNINNTTRQMTKVVVNTMTDNVPVTGIVINSQGAFANKTSNGHEIVSVCDTGSNPTGTVAGYTVATYWSDEDNACIAVDKSPNFISCPVGYTWDVDTQKCISNSGSGGTATPSSSGSSSPGGCCSDPAAGTGSGSDTGGKPTADSGSNSTDLGTAGQGGGAQPEGQPILTVSKDWTFILNVGVDTDDSCTKGNPLEAKPYIPIYDVSPETSGAFDDLGYNHGNGVTQIGQYINSTKSALYNQVIRKVVVKALSRLIDSDSVTCSGFMYCQIINYPTQKIMANIGTSVDVATIDVNDQSLTFVQDDNNYRTQVGDLIVISYYDPSSTSDKAIRVKRTAKDTFDSVNSFYAVRAELGYLGNADQDFGATIYV